MLCDNDTSFALCDPPVITFKSMELEIVKRNFAIPKLKEITEAVTSKATLEEADSFHTDNSADVDAHTAGLSFQWPRKTHCCRISNKCSMLQAELLANRKHCIM